MMSRRRSPRFVARPPRQDNARQRNGAGSACLRRHQSVEMRDESRQSARSRYGKIGYYQREARARKEMRALRRGCLRAVRREFCSAAGETYDDTAASLSPPRCAVSLYARRATVTRGR